MIPSVLVHGFMGGSDQWQGQSAALGGAVIAVDLPGFGRNAGQAPLDSIAGYAQWVLDTLAARDIHRFNLLGHSMGGMIAQEMTHIAPGRIADLVLYATGALGALPGRFEPIETSKDRARRDGPAATARRISATWFAAGEQAPGFADCAEIAQQTGLPAMLAGLDAMRDWSGEAQLSGIAARTLVLWGDQDRTYSWAQTQALWQEIPRAALAVLPGCAHAAHLEKPELFNAVLRDFLTP